MNRVRWVTLLLGVTLLLAACQAAPPAATSTAPEDKNGTVPTTAADVPRISLQDLRKLLDQGANVTLVDTRSADEYAAGHIPGSLTIPYAEIEARYRELSVTSQIVLYCA